MLNTIIVQPFSLLMLLTNLLFRLYYVGIRTGNIPLQYTIIADFIKIFITILIPRLLNDGCFEHLEGVEGTSDKGAGGHRFKTHLFPYRLILLKFLRRNKSHDR